MFSNVHAFDIQKSNQAEVRTLSRRNQIKTHVHQQYEGKQNK